MLTDVPDLKGMREERDAQLQTTFLRAFNLVDELTDIQRKAIPGANVTLTFEQMQRFTAMLAFCSGYAAGAAGVPPNHWRKIETAGDKT